MACFLVPTAQAVITTIAAKVLKSKEKEKSVKVFLSDGLLKKQQRSRFPLNSAGLTNCSGRSRLAFGHLWHGEIVPFFPFLTAVKSGETEMLQK